MNVIGIGTDIVAVRRFAHWHEKSCKQLRRIFSEEELSDIFKEPSLTSQRFATRFAAKEALYKALCQANVNWRVPFLFFCSQVSVNKSSTVAFIVNWDALCVSYCNILLTLSHTEEYAVAFVVMTGIHK
jgi:phosphopantetheine--protein transferase-like protein